MKKLAFAISCPHCRIEFGSHKKVSWAVPLWPDDVKVPKPGLEVDLPEPARFPIMPITCHSCEHRLTGNAKVNETFRMNLDTGAMEKIRIYAGVEVFHD